MLDVRSIVVALVSKPSVHRDVAHAGAGERCIAAALFEFHRRPANRVSRSYFRSFGSRRLVCIPYGLVLFPERFSFVFVVSLTFAFLILPKSLFHTPAPSITCTDRVGSLHRLCVSDRFRCVAGCFVASWQAWRHAGV